MGRKMFITNLFKNNNTQIYLGKEIKVKYKFGWVLYKVYEIKEVQGKRYAYMATESKAADGWFLVPNR